MTNYAKPSDVIPDHIDTCASEPIHIPGFIQPFGHLLALEGPLLRLSHVSANSAGPLLSSIDELLGQPLGDIPGLRHSAELLEALRRLPGRGQRRLGLYQSQAGETFEATAHRSPDGFTVLELETQHGTSEDRDAMTLEDLHPLIRDTLDRLASATTVAEITAAAAREVRRITKFDRVLIYRFEEAWDGLVVAEDGNGRLPSYLDLRFPASDIPAQARALYAANRLRLVANTEDKPVPIFPVPRPPLTWPLDLSFAMLRSVSPAHIEYMRNMRTPASMSVSLLVRGRLWGLISCHHATPRRVATPVRAACDLIGQMLALRIAAKMESAQAEERSRLKEVQEKLVASIASAASADPNTVLDNPADICALAGAAGAALVTQDDCRLVGQTPDAAATRRLADWLMRRGFEDVFETVSLPNLLPDAGFDTSVACGVLAIAISQLHPSYLLWFRPELVYTVTWGGEPGKPSESDGRLSPRRSFNAWKETVRGRALPWSTAQIEAARGLRETLVNIVLQHAEQRADLASQLERINGELTAFSYSISHELRTPFRHINAYAELLLERAGDQLDEDCRRYATTIINSAERAGLLVDALLRFSQLGRDGLTPVRIQLRVLVDEVVQSLEMEHRDRVIEWRIGRLPAVTADPTMLRLVLQNLISNALKFSRDRHPAIIEIDGYEDRSSAGALVRDNGVGFDMAYAHKLFGVFQQLHKPGAFDGLGIGLATVRRIVGRHGGRTWAEGEPDSGATFYFSLPREGPSPGKNPQG